MPSAVAGFSVALPVLTGGSASAVLGDSSCVTVGAVVEAPAAVVVVAAAVLVPAVVVVTAAVVVVTGVVVVVVVAAVVVVTVPTTVKVADAVSLVPPMPRAVTECDPIVALAGTVPEYLKVPSALTLSGPLRFAPSQKTLTRAPPVKSLPLITSGAPGCAESGLTEMAGEAWKRSRLSASKIHCMLLHRRQDGATGFFFPTIRGV